MYTTISEKKVASAMGAKTSRACDSCLSKRARWFCAADDAFLCQACDVSVHSSSHLASRHERVHLETSSFKTIDTKNCAPAWHQGFTRKPRTPRNGKKGALLGQRKKEQENMFNPLPFVPEMGCEDELENENDQEQLLYLVPVFDPFEVQDNLVLHLNGGDDSTTMNMKELDMMFNDHDQLINACDDLGIHHEFLSNDIVEGFLAADGLDGNINDEETRIINDEVVEEKTVKIEVGDEEMRAVLDELDMEREVLMNWDDFDRYESRLIAEDDDQESTVEHKVVAAAATETDQFTTAESCSTRKLLLRLNHESVINAWPNQSSPWTNGVPPHLILDDRWPDFLKSYPGEGGADHEPYGEIGGHVRGDNGGREAIVSRYREKRRTRLFSKKIRYQVRKLNAEKRPRLKGRFVKRTSFPHPAFPYLMNK